MKNMETLERLWAMADREAERTGPLFDLGCIGLHLQRPLSNAGYNFTPTNSSTFAGTGGDGVHFGLLHINGEVSDDSPVVMTVPMMFEEANVVLGENLLEFLRLGCQVGYFDLEQLVYDKQEAIRSIAHPQTWAEEIKSWIDQQEAYGFDAATRAIGQFMETGLLPII